MTLSCAAVERPFVRPAVLALREVAVAGAGPAVWMLIRLIPPIYFASSLPEACSIWVSCCCHPDPVRRNRHGTSPRHPVWHDHWLAAVCMGSIVGNPEQQVIRNTFHSYCGGWPTDGILSPFTAVLFRRSVGKKRGGPSKE